MRNQLLIAVLLGLVSAVVFASATTGPMLMRYVLFLLTMWQVHSGGFWRFNVITGAVLLGAAIFSGRMQL